MKFKHKVKFVFWSIIVAIAMTNDKLRFEYSDYREEAWRNNHTSMDSKEWLHRRWFPKKWDYEHNKI